MRSRNSLIRDRKEAVKDARLVIIAAEGKDTERIYFEALAKEYTNPRADEEKRLCLENKKNTRRTDIYLKTLLRKKMGSYHESGYDTSKLIPHVETAIERAKALDTNPADRWPQTLGTRVYLLAESIMNK